MSKKIRVGILGRVFIDWSGGIDLLIYIANAVALNKNYEVTLLVPDREGTPDVRINNEEELKRVVPTIRKRLLGNIRIDAKNEEGSKKIKLDPAFNDLSSNVKIVFYPNTQAGFIQTLKNKKINIILPTTSALGKSFPIPWLGYIWDFQHKHLAKYFSKDQITGRDRAFGEILAESPAVIVNSQAVANDIQSFYKKYSGSKKIFAMPFSPYPAASWLKASSKNAQKKYKIPNKYFIISNQFWLHKSHETAIKAMQTVVASDPHIHLVCTGKLEEPRDPAHIDRLKSMVKKLGLSENIHFLGLIPKNDQIALVRGAISLVQPTLYEGGPGGGSSYNAIALGVPVIASNIDINKEMSNENVTFFTARNSTDLAKKMLSASKSRKTPPTDARLIHDGKKRLEKLSRTLSDGIDFALESYKV